MTPLTKNRHSDHTLDLSFANQEFDEFFSHKTVYVFKKAFPGARNRRLHNMYLIGLDDDNAVNDFRNLSNVPYADFIGDITPENLSTPNEYISNAVIPTQHVDGNPIIGLPTEHLELIKAKKAWNISKGSSNVAVGVIDNPFYPNHPDLINKITTHYGNVWNSSSSSNHQHGTKVVGLIAAENENNIGIASIGYNSSMVTMKIYDQFTPQAPHPFDDATTTAQQKLFLVQEHPEIKVLNYSNKQGGALGSCSFIEANALVYEEIWNEYGVTTIAAAGNGEWGNSCNDAQGDNAYVYPASYDHVISVSSVGSHYPYGTLHENGNQFALKDVHQFIIGNLTYIHTHNDKVDLVAPGYGVPTTNLTDGYATGFGTSYASPIVAGTVALMYDVYPTITPDEVKQILQNSADDISHIPENEPYLSGLGAGRLNAYAAVLTAKCMYEDDPNPDLDLMMQNSKDDFGVEPDTETDIIWNSPDIWVRNQPDGHLYMQSEDLEYNGSGDPVYVYVRVTNDSCKESSGTDELKLYWAKGGLYQQWPNVWDGSSNTGNLEIGGLIQTLNIPALTSGESTILEFQWVPQNPSAYETADFEKPWMFCFLSRIVSNDDLMTTAEGNNAAINTRNNNNIAYKNETVIDVSDIPNQGSIVAGNIGGTGSLTTDIEFFKNNTIDDNLWQDAEVRLELNGDLWNLWQNSGAQSTNVRILDPNQRLVLLTNNHASLSNIAMQSGEWGIATLGVNFLINQVDAQEDYQFHVQQLETSTSETLGGFSYTFTRDNQRQVFNAQTNRTENTDGSETFYAGNINEGAAYNWYDKDGNLIYSGSDFTVNNTIAEEYKLEVIADTDGHKDYKTVETEDKRGIEYISPNPATTSTIVEYLLAPDDNAFIKLTHSVTGMYYNYILDAESSSQSIPTNQLPTGTYIVNLITNGNMLDAKQLIIN